jgi:hypothetical protein
VIRGGGTDYPNDDELEYSSDGYSVEEDIAKPTAGVSVPHRFVGSSSSSSSSPPKPYMLYGPGESRDYKHPVRLSPDEGSPIGGYIVTGMTVNTDIVDGNWMLVRCHRRNIIKNRGPSSGGIDAVTSCKWGWSVIADSGHVYLRPALSTGGAAAAAESSWGSRSPPGVKIGSKGSIGREEVYNLDDFDEEVSAPPHHTTMASSKPRTFSFTQRTPSKAIDPTGVHEWTQCTDEHGQVYYYNPQVRYLICYNAIIVYPFISISVSS